MENSTMKTGNPVANEEDFQKVKASQSEALLLKDFRLS